MKPKRIRALFVDEHDSSKQNGIGTYRDLLLPALAREAGMEVALISLNSDADNPMFIRRDYGMQYAIPKIDGGRWREHGQEIWPLLRRKIRDSKRNVFMINHSPCAEFVTELRRHYPRSKVVFIIHDQGWCAPLLGSRRFLTEIMIDGKLPENVSKATADHVRHYCAIEREIYDLVDKVVCLSPTTRRLLTEIYGVDKSKIALIPNGFARSAKLRRPGRSEARKRLGISADEELLIFAGRPAQYKGIEALLMAADSLHRRRPKLRCVMCGAIGGFSNFGDDLSHAASALIFTGLIPKHELRWWYAAANVGVMPSYSEQFGYSAIEMADSGLQMVTSDGPGLCDLFTDGETACVASIGDDVTDIGHFAAELEKAVERALDSTSSQSRSRTANCRKMISETYSVEMMAGGYADMMRTIA